MLLDDVVVRGAPTMSFVEEFASLTAQWYKRNDAAVRDARMTLFREEVALGKPNVEEFASHMAR